MKLLLLFISFFFETFSSADFKTTINNLISRTAKNCFLSSQILTFYQKAQKENKDKAKKAIMTNI
jgi:hypothetical protein